MREALVDGDALVLADGDADDEGVGVDVLSLLVEDVEVGLGVAVGLLEDVPVEGLVGALVDPLGDGLGDPLAGGEGLLETCVICSHCCAAVAAACMASARAGDAVAALRAIADTLVKSVPPATRLIATGRTRVKHMKMSCPCCPLRLRNDCSV